jgi:citrate lyase subunit beta / citryl-CoA lyase
VGKVCNLLAEVCRMGNTLPPAVWCMIETPLGVLRADELAAMPQVSCLVAGTSDLAADLRCDGQWQQRAALLSSLSLTVLAARAHGKAVLDGVHLDLKDDAGFKTSCEQGRALGFDGKTLIHPNTLAVANETFAPSEAQVARARHIIGAFAAAVEAGSALVVLDGKLVEELHVREAQRLVAMAEAIESEA